MHTILSIEDNLMNINLMRRYLKNLSVMLIEAETGAEGITKAQSAQPDLILVDIHLPDMNGKEVVHRLREIPALKDVPIIALTADDKEILRKQCLTEGFNAYMTKPVSMTSLQHTIRQYLSDAPDRSIA